MNLLLNTHTFIWFIEGNTFISKKGLPLIEDTANNIFVSIISLYEIAIKQKTGKLILSNSLQNFFRYAASENITILPVSEGHLLEYNNVPLLANHRDPFDRLITATAVYQKLDIITIDAQFNNYSSLVNIIW
jgi:PIN domain nuclease of toxin-antitoxin system